MPEINEDEILIKVEDCGICAGDTKAYHGAEVGVDGEPELGAAEGGAPEGLPESRNEMKALPRRHAAA